MNTPRSSYFDHSAATWDSQPQRVALMKAVGETILREARPTPEMDLLDYGCGTGLVGLFLLPHVRSVTGADSSPGMLDVLRSKIREGNLTGMRAIQLDLEKEPVPEDRYHLIVSSMVMHHVADLDRVLAALGAMLLPGGRVCIADLDAEPGDFHPAEAAASVHHHGFDRTEFQRRLERAGLRVQSTATAHAVQRPVAGGELRDFPVFLMVAQR